MTVAIYVPLLASAVLALVAATTSRSLPPAVGLWTMVLATISVAAAGLWSLALLGAVLIDDIPAFDRIEPLVPVPDIVSASALIALAASVLRVGRTARRLRRDVAALRALATHDDLVIADASAADAFAIPGVGWRAGGAVYVTSGMLRALDPAQQRALFAHERAHLKARHGLARAVAALAAASNPMLGPARDAIAYLCERHADEMAATEVGSRAHVAKAVAAAALARSAWAAPIEALGMHRVAVADRVRALLAPPTSRYRWHVALVASTIALVAASVLDATHDAMPIALAIGHR